MATTTVLDRRVARLPSVFQRRIQHLRKGSHEFERRWLPLEVSVIELAMANYDNLGVVPEMRASFRRTPEGFVETAAKTLSEYHGKDLFQVSMGLYMLYATRPEAVVTAHGALAPLVGCAQYGCHPDGELPPAPGWEEQAKGPFVVQRPAGTVWGSDPPSQAA